MSKLSKKESQKAQPGRVSPSGGEGRRFKSSHSDQRQLLIDLRGGSLELFLTISIQSQKINCNHRINLVYCL